MLTLEINGKVYSIDCPPHYTLLEVLREKLGLTGTKHGCELGECGMCTVLIDGKPFLSCLVLPHTVQGCSIRTIEGIPPDHPVIQSFSVSGAVQCGYCTPAMVLSAVALLENNPTPTVEEIKQSLASVLCRCTGYEGIIKGVQLASQHGVSPTEPPRADAVEKASGKAMYTDDFLLPGTVFCRLKRSPYAHAWIKKISYEKALALPGVLKVLTGDDLP
ncbi:MAG: 2Fe-2S iron-sulfur cluster-binding protein, partial [bacterium JZ-2024 1]